MKIIHYFSSLVLLFLLGCLMYLIFAPINVNDYSVKDNELLKEYDYIVVGAGSAGNVVASRLAENNHTVLLLEAGVSDYIDMISMPLGVLSILTQEDYRYVQWGDKATFEKDGIKNSIEMNRGKVVGGCHSMNAMIWNKGNRNLYNKWEYMGAKGWKYNDIKDYYDRAEKTLWIDKETRFIHKSMRDLLKEAGNLYGFTESINTRSNGFATYETTMRNGRRWSTSDAYLKPTIRKHPKNFHLKLNATVSKILFNEKNTRAVKVELDNKQTFSAKNEIILSAGAFNSPTILMRSGIGNADELKNLGIKVIKNLTGVGEHMQTHPSSSIIFKTNETQWKGISEEPPSFCHIIDFLVFGTGPLSSNGVERGGYIKTKYAQFKEIEDLQFHCLPLFFNNPEIMKEKMKDNSTDSSDNYISCIITTVSARDSGSVKIRSNNPNDHPEIKINFLENEDDLNTIFEGFKIIDKIFQSPTFKDKTELYFPKREELNDKEKLKKYIYRSLFEIYHPTGTCKMGDIQKEDTVVDSNLKVIGFENLRVIDASVMPEITNSNTNAPTIMIAEKGADLILKEQKKF